MSATLQFGSGRSVGALDRSGGVGSHNRSHGGKSHFQSNASGFLDGVIEWLAPCPWGAHAGASPRGVQYSSWRAGELPTRQEPTRASKSHRAPLYTPSERLRRDTSPWTMVQGVLAPLQFLVCAVSALLILRYLATGQGYAVATGSILLKTVALYAIMVTGSIWEKDVFGKWLFAPAFFWEDAVSMVVIALQTTYVACLLAGWGTPAEQMMIAVAAYATYAVNAGQFLLKLRAARLDAAAMA
ncbi:hypothetical protein BH09PSE2_BH09PSE2_22970 [soil metagenome]